MQAILTGKFFDNIETQGKMKHYQSLASDLCLIDGIIFYEKKLIVVSSTLRYDMLTKLHESYFGIQKMKATVRQISYWRSMDADIKALTLKCSVCCSHLRMQQKNVYYLIVSSNLLDKSGHRYFLIFFSELFASRRLFL